MLFYTMKKRNDKLNAQLNALKLYLQFRISVSINKHKKVYFLFIHFLNLK